MRRQEVHLYIFFNCFICALKEHVFAIRQTRVQELNKNNMKLELLSCHGNTRFHRMENLIMKFYCILYRAIVYFLLVHSAES